MNADQLKKEDMSVTLFNILIYIGAWPGVSKNGKYTNTRKFYYRVLMANYFLSFFAECFFVYSNINDMAIVIESLCIIILVGGSLIKIHSYMYTSDAVEKLRFVSISNIYNTEIPGGEVTNLEIIRTIKKTIGNIYKFMIACGIGAISFKLIGCIVVSERTFPAPFDLPFINTTETPNYQIIFTNQFFTVYLAVIGIITMDVMVLDFLLKIRWKYYILLQKVKHYGVVHNNIHSGKETVKHGSIQHLKNVKEALKDCVDYHKMLIM